VVYPAYLRVFKRTQPHFVVIAASTTTSTFFFFQFRRVSPCSKDVSVLLVFLNSDTSLYLPFSITQFHSFSRDLFIIVIPFLFLFFCQSPRIRCSIVSSIVAVVGSITTRGSPEAPRVLKGANSYNWKQRGEVIRQENSIINAFLFLSSYFLLFCRYLPFFPNVHIVSKRTSVFSISLKKGGNYGIL
jgi:hypothetical protein